MPVNGNALGDDIKADIDAVPDKTDRTLLMRAMGNSIADAVNPELLLAGWEAQGTAVLIDGTTPVAVNVDAVNLRWAFALVSGITLEYVCEYMDRSRCDYKLSVIALRDNPNGAGNIVGNTSNVGGNVNYALSLADGGDGYCYLRYTTGIVGQNRNMRWRWRSLAALS